jgi:hypothetical protein
VIVVPFFGSDSSSIRLQPWTETTYSKELRQFSGRYYDFRVEPGLIESVLEDFSPHAGRPAIRRFYEILRWVNSAAESTVESSDCAFRSPHLAEDNSLFRFRLQCDGRLEFFHRDLEINTEPATFYQFVASFCVLLQMQNRSFSGGIVEVSHAMTEFTRLPAGRQRGGRICARFVAYGNTEAESFANLKTVFECLAGGLVQLSSAWPSPG